MRTIELLSTEEASDHIGVNTHTLYRFIYEGQLPAYRFGRVIRLKAADVEAYIERCRIKPGDLSHLSQHVHLPESA